MKGAADAVAQGLLNSNWNAEAARHCPTCFRAIGQQHDPDCDVFGLVVKGAP